HGEQRAVREELDAGVPCKSAAGTSPAPWRRGHARVRGVGCDSGRRFRASPSSDAGTCHCSAISMRPLFLDGWASRPWLVALPKELSARRLRHLRRGGRIGGLPKLGVECSDNAGFNAQDHPLETTTCEFSCGGGAGSASRETVSR